MNCTLTRLIEEGGDWDRLNRLKVYRAINLLNSRQFKKAGDLLVDSLSTFTASELIDYNDFVGLAVIVNVLVQKRVDLKKKVRLYVGRHGEVSSRCVLWGLDYRVTRSNWRYCRGTVIGDVPNVDIQLRLRQILRCPWYVRMLAPSLSLS